MANTSWLAHLIVSYDFGIMLLANARKRIFKKYMVMKRMKRMKRMMKELE
jgi:hypothetical protein